MNIKIIKAIILICSILFVQSVQCQELNFDIFKWENRVLLVLADDSTNKIYHQQLEELWNHKEGLKERKLVIVEIQKDKYKVDGTTKGWHLSNSLYEKFSSLEDDFQILLIGLDGGIKVRKNEILIVEDLFNEIDSMPMRKAELQMNNNK